MKLNIASELDRDSGRVGRWSFVVGRLSSGTPRPAPSERQTTNDKRQTTRGAFTLIEALAAVAITGIAVASLLGGLGAIAKGEARAKETERMTQLAADKFEEITATRAYLTAATNGDFRDRGEERYTWEAEVLPSGIENLDAISVTVQRESQTGSSQVQVSGLMYTPPTITEGESGGTP